MKGFFLTGTDTGCGKTFVSCEILRHLSSKGLDVVGLKPIASGAKKISDELRKEDVTMLWKNSNINIKETDICRYIFPEACSPHIASLINNENIELDSISNFVDNFTDISDIIVVEGIGGWHVPINSTERVSELAEVLDLPVLLVVSNKLGCLNHASLTYEAILRTKVKFSGWILNKLENNIVASRSVESSLEKILGCAPILTVEFKNNSFSSAQFERFSELIMDSVN